MDATQIKSTLTEVAQKALATGDHGTVLDAIDRLGEQKPGIRTTEFWLSTVTSTIGGILVMLPGKEIYGTVLLAVSAISYALSRGLAKQAAMLFLAVSLGLAGGCSAPGYVRADAIDDAVMIVCGRHDAYVKADPALSDEQKSAKLDTSVLLLKVVADAKAQQNKPAAGTAPVTTK